MTKENQTSSADNVAGKTVSRKLREYYDSVMEEAIPDRFLDLLEQLDAADSARNKGSQKGKVGNGG